MRKKDKEQFEEINKRLDALIRISLRHNETQELTSREQIEMLRSVGLRDIEIARILGKSRGYISSELNKIRARGVKNDED